MISSFCPCASCSDAAPLVRLRAINRILDRCDMYQRDRRRQRDSAFLRSTIAAAVVAFLVYPMTVAPLGGLSNGGAAGLFLLVVAAGLAWRGLILNTVDARLRRCVQVPLTAIITYLVIADAVAQYRSGHWLW